MQQEHLLAERGHEKISGVSNLKPKEGRKDEKAQETQSTKFISCLPFFCCCRGNKRRSTKESSGKVSSEYQVGESLNCNIQLSNIKEVNILIATFVFLSCYVF